MKKSSATTMDRTTNSGGIVPLLTVCCVGLTKTQPSRCILSSWKHIVVVQQGHSVDQIAGTPLEQGGCRANEGDVK